MLLVVVDVSTLPILVFGGERVMFVKRINKKKMKSLKLNNKITVGK